MTSTDFFLPDWISPPGDTIADLLAERQMSPFDLARETHLAIEKIHALLSGDAPITADLAPQLAKILGATADFWIARESIHQAQLARIHERSTPASDQWLGNLPVKDMVRFGWIERGASRPQTAINCMRFFGTPDLATWHTKWGRALSTAAFRSSFSFAALPAPVAAWLRQGEIQAEAIESRPWDATRFHALLPNLRGLTRKSDPAFFLPELQQRCAECGVAVVIVRTPEGCPASGATRFVSAEKALLMLSFRYLSDDQFWFTFFHEAGHLLLHGEQSLFLEGSDEFTGQQEDEANQFAGENLIPAALRPAMLKLPLDARKVIRFATQAGVSPGVVVGQLQHQGVLTYRQLNDLKRRYVWGG